MQQAGCFKLSLALAPFILVGQVLAQTCNIRGFSNERAQDDYSIINGSSYSDFRLILTDRRFFSPGTGAVPLSISLQQAIYRISPGSFGFPANITDPEVFCTGWTLASSYNEYEKTTLRQYVLAGGSLLLQVDDIEHSIVDLFGLTQNPAPKGGGSNNQILVNTDHVILNGPFGRVQKLVPSGFVGQFTSVPGNAITLVQNVSASGAAAAAVVVFPEGALGPNSGRVIILNDSDYASNSAPTAGLPDNDIFMLNVFAYACGVPNVPGGGTYYFPQIAYNGGYTTQGRVTSALNSGVSVGRFEMFNNDGNSVYDCGLLTIHPNASPQGCFMSGSTANAVRTGWARARMAGNPPFVNFFASLQYSLREGNTLVTAVGVPPSTPGTSFTLNGPILANSKIGLAILNLPTSLRNAMVTIRAYNNTGSQIGNTGTIRLMPGENTAQFIDQIVGVGSAVDVDMNASVTLTSNDTIAVLGLVFDMPARIFSTIPVFPGRK